MRPFKRLLWLVARAFYADDKLAVAVLDALARRGQWVSEEDLARDLNLRVKLLRQCLSLLAKEKFLVREELAKRKISKSYCCLHYGQIYDVVRYRLHYMRKRLQGDAAAAVQEYICDTCTKRYSDFDAASLISFETGAFHCENCNHELAAVLKPKDSEKLLHKMNVQLKPLMELLNSIDHMDVPEFATLQDWEEAKSSEIQVEVFLSQDVHHEDTQPEAKRQKVQPPWMSMSQLPRPAVLGLY